MTTTQTSGNEMSLTQTITKSRRSLTQELTVSMTEVLQRAIGTGAFHGGVTLKQLRELLEFELTPHQARVFAQSLGFELLAEGQSPSTSRREVEEIIIRRFKPLEEQLRQIRSAISHIANELEVPTPGGGSFVPNLVRKILDLQPGDQNVKTSV